MDAEKTKQQASLALILAIAGIVVAAAAGAVLFLVPRSAGINITIILLALLSGGAAGAGSFLAGRAKEQILPGQAGRQTVGTAGTLSWVGIVAAGWVLLYILALLAPQLKVHVLVGLGEVVQTLLIILAAAAAISGLTYLVLGVLFKSRHALPFVLLAPAIVGLCMLVVYPMGYEIRLAFSNMSLRYFKNPTYSLTQGWENFKRVFTQPVLKRTMFLPALRDSTGYLFDLDLGFAGELEDQIVSSQLREQFQARGKALSPEAQVTFSGPYQLGDKSGTYWNITDAGVTYKIIRYEGGPTLDVEGPTRVLDPGLFVRTILWTGIQVPFHVIGGLVLALLLNRPMKLRGLYRALLVIPWALPPIVAVLAWRGEFHFEYGFINIMLRGLGLAAVQWKTDPTANFIAMNIVNIWLGIPFMMVILLGGLQSIPGELYEAAEIDGASWWQQFRRITWPLLQPVLTPAIILGVIWTFNNFNVPFFINDNELETSDILVTALFRAAFQYNQYGFAAAFALVIFVILLAFSVFYIHTTGALRGVTEAAPTRRRRPKRSLRRGGEKGGSEK